MDESYFPILKNMMLSTSPGAGLLKLYLIPLYTQYSRVYPWDMYHRSYTKVYFSNIVYYKGIGYTPRVAAPKQQAFTWKLYIWAEKIYS